MPTIKRKDSYKYIYNNRKYRLIIVINRMEDENEMREIKEEVQELKELMKVLLVSMGSPEQNQTENRSPMTRK